MRAGPAYLVAAVLALGCAVEVGETDAQAWDSGSQPQDDDPADPPPRPPRRPATVLGDRERPLSLVVRLEQDVGDPSAALRFVDLATGAPSPTPASTPSLLALSPARGQVDVFIEDDHEWTWHGSYFAGGRPVAVESGQVGGRTFVAVRTEDHEVMVCFVDATDPRRLAFPVRAFRDRAGIHDLALVDATGDGDDDLVVAHRDQLTLVSNLADLEAADPEHLPRMDTQVLQRGVVEDLATWTLSEETLLIASSAEEARMNVFPLPADDAGPPFGVALPTAASRLSVAGSMLFILGGGQHVDVLGEGWTVEPLDSGARGIEGAATGFVRWSARGGPLTAESLEGEEPFVIDVPWDQIAWSQDKARMLVGSAQGDAITIYEVLHAPW